MSALSEQQVREFLREKTLSWDIRGRKVLLIVPDQTRTAPIGLLFRELSRLWLGVCARLDVMVALGTHSAMTEEEICRRLEISLGERRTKYASVRLFNHEWSNPEALKTLGIIPSDEIRTLTSGLFAMDVPVQLNRRVDDYDCVVILGPVYPHEVVGFSGGNKYLFPGIAGPEIINFFHWMGAVITSPAIIGRAYTPVRKVVDRAAQFLTMPKYCICIVTDPGDGGAAMLTAGTPESAWEEAWHETERLHVTFKKNPYKKILSCAPQMYNEIWTAGKCMYKLEPVLADGGELIIYAPEVTEISDTHGKLILETGYHCRDFFLKQWDKYKTTPWGVLAHCTHVFGAGTYDAATGIEIPRARVTLATGIPEAVCRKINLGYRDPATIRKEEYANRENEGILLVPRAGEMLYRLENN